MTRRFMSVAAAVVLVATGCGGSSDPSVNAGSVRARPLVYSLTGDVTLQYHTEMETAMTVAFGEELTSLDPSMPSTMETEMAMAFDSTYRIEDGPEPDTYRVAMSLDNIELESGSVQMGREKVDLSDVPQREIDAALASQLPEFVYIINDRGEVVSVEFGGVALNVEGLLGGTSTGSFTGGQMFGPQLPEGEVNVGDSWTTTSTQDFGEKVIETEETHTILRTEERNGIDTWVIRSKMKTDAFTVTWEDMIALYEDFGGIQNMEGMDGMPVSFQMAMRSSPTSTTMMTWLDPASGRTVAVDINGNVAMTMEMGGIPGMAGSFSMDMDGYTHIAMELTR
ncbi:MAG: hypothetical protein QNJ75_04600 [Acidimicrobiia bacterium]|nr:hypothetical protein [Acidimicrobiia bacterium]